MGTEGIWLPKFAQDYPLASGRGLPCELENYSAVYSGIVPLAGISGAAFTVISGTAFTALSRIALDAIATVLVVQLSREFLWLSCR